MRLWLLESRGPAGLDCTRAQVLRAGSEDQARIMAQRNGGDECCDYAAGRPVPFWTDPSKSTCVELTPEGEPGPVISNRREA